MFEDIFVCLKVLTILIDGKMAVSCFSMRRGAFDAFYIVRCKCSSLVLFVLGSAQILAHWVGMK